MNIWGLDNNTEWHAKYTRRKYFNIYRENLYNYIYISNCSVARPLLIRAKLFSCFHVL